MTDHACCLEAQHEVKLNWKDQFRLRSSLLKTPDGVTLVGTEECRACGALWFYDGRTPRTGADEIAPGQHVYWYTPASAAMIARCDAVAQSLAERGAGGDSALDQTLDALDAEMRAVRGARPWLRLVDQGPGAEWAALGSWQPRPAV